MKKALALSALALAFLFVTGFQTTSQLASQLTTIQFQLVNLKTQISGLEAQVTSLTNKGPRKFYLTKADTHTGAQALSACAEGYHMASLREIHDTSNLRYDTDLGFTLSDSGFGPPNQDGWIRTGISANTVPLAGTGNCLAWTSDGSGDPGTSARFFNVWNATASVISPWESVIHQCNTPRRVWCVQD